MYRTLIVEENSAFLQTFKRLLHRHFPWMTVMEAGNGFEAFRKVEVYRPELVFIDMRLGETSGLELTERIKTSRPETLVVVLTDYDFPEYQEAAYHGGADRFIAKGSLDLSVIGAMVKAPIGESAE